jgi:hypothetical protein
MLLDYSQCLQHALGQLLSGGGELTELAIGTEGEELGCCSSAVAVASWRKRSERFPARTNLVLVALSREVIPGRSGTQFDSMVLGFDEQG